jgi:hypothetical protein
LNAAEPKSRTAENVPFVTVEFPVMIPICVPPVGASNSLNVTCCTPFIGTPEFVMRPWYVNEVV